MKITTGLAAALLVGGGILLFARSTPRAPGGPPPLGPVDGFDLPPTDLDRVQVGDEAPDFTLEAYVGDPVTLSDFRGDKIVVLVFYRGHW